MFILSFDFGQKYIGVAVGQYLTFTSRPLFSVLFSEFFSFYEELFSIILFWKPKYILVGYPISDIYDNSFILDKIDHFVYLLRLNFFCDIFFINENLSTWFFKKKLIFYKNKINKSLFALNAYSAKLLIEQWFNDNFF